MVNHAAPACTAPATARPLSLGSNFTSAMRPLRTRVHVARAASALRNKPVLVAASTTPDAATAMRLTKVKSGTLVAGSTAQVTPSVVAKIPFPWMASAFPNPSPVPA